MTSAKDNEIILAVPRTELFENERLDFQGIRTDEETVKRINKNINLYYTTGKRGKLEKDTAYKQPIPYPVIRRGNEFFVTERLKGGGEERLFNQHSLGAGGHMNPIEGITEFSELVTENLRRELAEEVSIGTTVYRITIQGFINDDANDVGEVHIGLLAFVDVPEGTEVSVLETDKHRGYWASLEELKKPEQYEKMENWSKLILDTI